MRQRSGGYGNRSDIDCYNYKKHGYYAQDCWAEMMVEGKVNYAEENVEDMLMMVHN
jgi:hypothetical protein